MRRSRTSPGATRMPISRVEAIIRWAWCFREVGIWSLAAPMSCWLAIVARLGVLGVPHEAQALSDTPRARAARGSGRAELSVVAVALRACVSFIFAAGLLRAVPR